MTGRVHRGDVGGVAAFWVDSGRPTLSGSLIFRHGMVDETLSTSGWTHLLEHLALHGRGKGPLQVNGSVSLLHTRFDAHGPADAVATTLTAVSEWLSVPEFGELDRERSVLRAEALVRGPGEISQGLMWRYGARGPGLSACVEPGLARVTPTALTDLARSVFVRENCALYLDGPPPDSLRLDLPSGALRPPPRAVPCSNELPGAYLVASGIVMSGVAPRSTAAMILAHVLREQFTAEFRERYGSAYAPWSHYEPVDDESAVLLWGSDADHVLRQTIAERALVQLSRLVGGTLKTALVMDAVDQMVQSMSDPYNLAGLASRAAVDHLRSAPARSLQECVEEARSVRFADVTDVAGALQATLLMGIGGEALWKRELPMLSMPIGPRQAGTSHLSMDFPASRECLVVGTDSLQIGSAKSSLTLRGGEIVGMLVYPDGGRQVVDKDGWSIAVEPTLWRRGRAAVAAVDALVPCDLHLAMPDRGPDRVPRPASARRRASHVGRQLWMALRAQYVFVLLALSLPLLAVAFATVGMGALAGLFALGAWLWRREVERGLPSDWRERAGR